MIHCSIRLSHHLPSTLCRTRRRAFIHGTLVLEPLSERQLFIMETTTTRLAVTFYFSRLAACLKVNSEPWQPEVYFLDVIMSIEAAEFYERLLGNDIYSS